MSGARLNRRVDRELWSGSFVQPYIERDVRHLLRVTDLESFRRFLFLVATRTGSHRAAVALPLVPGGFP